MTAAPRRCEVCRGGVWCGRTAKVRVGISVWGHRPAVMHNYCQEHADLYAADMTYVAAEGAMLVIEGVAA